MTQPSIQTLLTAGFADKAIQNSSDAYASVNLASSSGGFTPTRGAGNPCHFAAVFDRRVPSSGPVYQKVSTSSTDIPAGLDAYLNDSYILFWISAAFVTSMPQGNLYKMLAANGGGSKLRRMEVLTTSFACGVGCGMVYMMSTVPGPVSHGIEFLELRNRSTGKTSQSSDLVYSNQATDFVSLVELMPSPTGLYSPVELN